MDILEGAWFLDIQKLVSGTSRKAPGSGTTMNWFLGHRGSRFLDI